MALRETSWPAVGEELEAKSNGLWHRATVAEIGQGWPGNVGMWRKWMESAQICTDCHMILIHTL